MLEARDWVLRNLLFLNPDLPPFNSRVDGVGQQSQGGHRDTGTRDGDAENAAGWLQTFTATVAVGDRVSEFRLRCTTEPERAILLCNREGVQLKALRVPLISTSTRTLQKTISLAVSDDNVSVSDVGRSSVQIDLTFKSTIQCRDFAQALQQLFQIETIDAQSKSNQRKTFAQSSNKINRTIPIHTLTIQGSGSFGNPITQDPNSHRQHTHTPQAHTHVVVASQMSLSG